jgi:1-acyl-sn-glycerol-3-phosphate acyltransferase
MLRGYITLAILAVTVVTADLAERLFLAPILRLLPKRRDRLLTRWMRGLASIVVNLLRTFGGTRIPDPPRIPGSDGVLVVMNHQSLLDIPLAIRCLVDSYPRIVTRRRYATGIPLVSHLLRLTKSPLVEPGRSARSQLLELSEVARTSRAPLVIFPEGTRSRDGSVGAFRSAGLSAILAERDWLVYLVVADGLWPAAHFRELPGTIPRLRVQIESFGPISSPERGTNPEPWIRDLRDRAARELERMRADRPPDSARTS